MLSQNYLTSSFWYLFIHLYPTPANSSGHNPSFVDCCFLAPRPFDALAPMPISPFLLLLFGAEAFEPLFQCQSPFDCYFSLTQIFYRIFSIVFFWRQGHSMQSHQCQSYFDCWLLHRGICWHRAKAIPLLCCGHTAIVWDIPIVTAPRQFAAIGVPRLSHGTHWGCLLPSYWCC